MRILISGASRGLGKNLAYQLAKSGHDLILMARSEERLKSIKSDLEKIVKVEVIAVDLSDAEETRAAIGKISSLDKIDVLINNVGVYSENQASDFDTHELKSQLDINLWSAIHLTQAILPGFIQKKSGLILNINSVMGVEAARHAATYSISKHALKAWNDSLREELRNKGIKVSAIYPGAINTSSWDGIEADREAMIQTEDIAELVVTLLKIGSSTLVEEIHLSPSNFQP
jgi:short-subunit dehydrogenase